MLFIEFINTLIKYARKSPNFSYKPPSRITLATTLLQRVYAEVQAEKKEILKNTDFVLQADGCKNSVTNTKLMVFSLTNMRSSHLFLTCENINLDREDGDTLSNLFNKATKLAHDLYEAKVVSTTTDNDSKKVCGARMAITIDGKPLFQCTCGCHSGNLLVKSIAEAEDTNKINKVITAFRDSKIQEILLERNGIRLKNYPDTRFCFIRDTCESIIKNLKIM